jgi:uncharacterized membrane protein (UPF0127 family)
VITVATALLSVLACGSGSGLPTAKLVVDDQAITAEIAETLPARTKGLMMRDSVGANAGMLFVYDDDQIREFWMKDTRIPLSIAFLDRDGKILRIADMKPFDESRTSSLYPARYALEANVGWFDSHHVKKGDVVTGIPTDLKAE